jgi:hypothetical protein
MITWAETLVNYPDGQQNVNQPPDAQVAQGFIPETAGARGQPFPAQWANWLFQRIFRLINRDRVTDANGVGLFPYENAMIRLEAIDRDNPANYIVAVGFKPVGGGVHTLTVVSSNVLTLDTGTADGNQPVLGGTDVIVMGSTRQFGDI